MNQNITDIFELDSHYSTTRRVRQTTADIVAAELKAAHKPEDAFETLVFLPEGHGRQGEGGLRTQGYFKLSTDDKPLITVVTVVFNGEQFLEETILSVINQTYDNVEYIIIDGGSTDGTLDIIKKYEHAIDYWVSEKDNGIYDAWNKAVKLSHGDWVAFLGADDIYLYTAIKSYVDKILALPKSMEYISSRVLLVDENKAPLRIIGNAWSWRVFRRYMNVGHVGSMHSQKLFKMHGLFSLDYRVASDYELLLRRREKLNAAYMNLLTVQMRNGGVSNAFYMKALSESFEIKFNFSGSSLFFIYFCYILALIKIKVRSYI